MACFAWTANHAGPSEIGVAEGTREAGDMTPQSPGAGRRRLAALLASPRSGMVKRR